MLNGKINRRGFLIACVAIYLMMIATHYLLLWIMQLLDETGILFVELNSILSFIYLAVFIFFVVRRLNDINATVWWSLIFCIRALFSLRNIVLADYLWNIKIDPFATPLVILNAASLILFLVLLFKASSHNTSLQPTPTLSRRLG